MQKLVTWITFLALACFAAAFVYFFVDDGLYREGAWGPEGAI